jgi:CDP-paratose 2-epimerase
MASGQRVLVTGGAGFVGSNVSVALAAAPGGREVVALDNLKRRGSEINLPRLRAAGVRFAHGDVRNVSDLEAAGEIDALVECSAEPSVLADIDGGTDFTVHTNLVGAYNCLELARRNDAQFVFLSTSRVYPVDPLNALSYSETDTRFELDDEQPVPGASRRGIAESFPLEGPRTLYGATKLAAELLVTEYARNFGLRTVVDRCGVIVGPWQMGKVDQGVYTHWLLSHHLRRDLSYIGYGGQGKQVRDLLHVQDLVELIEDQLARPEHWAGVTVNVGGGRECSLSLAETTTICRELTGNEVRIGSIVENRPGDVPLYLSDCERLSRHTDWTPRRGAREILEDIHDWIRGNEAAVVAALG